MNPFHVHDGPSWLLNHRQVHNGSRIEVQTGDGGWHPVTVEYSAEAGWLAVGLADDDTKIPLSRSMNCRWPVPLPRKPPRYRVPPVAVLWDGQKISFKEFAEANHGLEAWHTSLLPDEYRLQLKIELGFAESHEDLIRSVISPRKMMDLIDFPYGRPADIPIPLGPLASPKDERVRGHIHDEEWDQLCAVGLLAVETGELPRATEIWLHELAWLAPGDKTHPRCSYCLRDKLECRDLVINTRTLNLCRPCLDDLREFMTTGACASGVVREISRNRSTLEPKCSVCLRDAFGNSRFCSCETSAILCEACARKDCESLATHYERLMEPMTLFDDPESFP